jgi:hypothetical protein
MIDVKKTGSISSSDSHMTDEKRDLLKEQFKKTVIKSSVIDALTDSDDDDFVGDIADEDWE